MLLSIIVEKYVTPQFTSSHINDARQCFITRGGVTNQLGARGHIKTWGPPP